jgi:hypothetical protein
VIDKDKRRTAMNNDKDKASEVYGTWKNDELDLELMI